MIVYLNKEDAIQLFQYLKFINIITNIPSSLNFECTNFTCDYFYCQTYNEVTNSLQYVSRKINTVRVAKDIRNDCLTKKYIIDYNYCIIDNTIYLDNKCNIEMVTYYG